MAGKGDRAGAADDGAGWLGGLFGLLRAVVDEGVEVLVAEDKPANTAEVEKRMRTVGVIARTAKFVDDLDISTFSGAQKALQIVDKALNAVNGARADLGAIQNRFTSVVANLQTSSENLAASRSRIRDTDFAKETAELTRTQILQQAGTAMLAQANQVPQNVLSLLK